MTLRTLNVKAPTVSDIRIERTPSVEFTVSDADRKAIEQQRRATLQSEVAKRNESRKSDTRRIAR
mgnify:FL=1